MTKKLLYLSIISILFYSCTSVEYLPYEDKVGATEFGGFIHVKTYDKEHIKGELLAINESSMYIELLNSAPSDSTDNIVISIPRKDISFFTLNYAKPKDFAWTIPVYAISTLSHGWFLIFTAPINIGITTAITLSAKRDFRYTSMQVNIEDIIMFARYPQGLPDGFETIDINTYNKR